jgi:hypothetical protein
VKTRPASLSFSRFTYWTHNRSLHRLSPHPVAVCLANNTLIYSVFLASSSRSCLSLSLSLFFISSSCMVPPPVPGNTGYTASPPPETENPGGFLSTGPSRPLLDLQSIPQHHSARPPGQSWLGPPFLGFPVCPFSFIMRSAISNGLHT